MPVRSLSPRQAAVVSIALCALLTGCAATSALRRGHAAEGRGDYDRAVAEYTRALEQAPQSADARGGLERTRLRASLDHLAAGRQLAARGDLEQAIVELQVANGLNPSSEDILRSLRATRRALTEQVSGARTIPESLRARAGRHESAEQAAPGRPLPLPDSVVFRNASSREALIALGRLAEVHVQFDPDFRDAPLTADLRGLTFEEAVGTVTASSGAFFRSAEGAIFVIPDTAAKRREYEDRLVRTFYLGNVDIKEAMDVLRVVIDARRVSPITAIHALTINDTPAQLEAAARLLRAVDKATPEVVVDVDLLEVTRSRLHAYGLPIASARASGVDGRVALVPSEGSSLSLESLRHLTQADIVLANLPGLYYSLLKNDADTRTLASPQLRASEGTTAHASFGERVPVPVTTFTPVASDGVAQHPITSFNYENVGVNIDVTPRVHHDNSVTLTVKLQISQLSGTGFGNLPTFSDRSITTAIRLRDGETSVLAGLVRGNVAREGDGVSGGWPFARSTHESRDTDLVLTLTPHVVRTLQLTEGNLLTYRAGREIIDPPPQPLPDVLR